MEAPYFKSFGRAGYGFGWEQTAVASIVADSSSLNASEHTVVWHSAKSREKVAVEPPYSLVEEGNYFRWVVRLAWVHRQSFVGDS